MDRMPVSCSIRAGSSDPGRMGSAARVPRAMPLLLLIPIVHTEQDLGSLAARIAEQQRQRHGAVKSEQHRQAILALWSSIREFIESLDLPYERVRLYQDGLPDSRGAAEIVAQVAAQGSKNYQLLQDLMKKGAKLMGTESPRLLAHEYELHRAPDAPGKAATEPGADHSRQLLAERDLYIAQRINATLGADEFGLLFLGLAHSVEPNLRPDIQVKNLLPSLTQAWTDARAQASE